MNSKLLLCFMLLLGACKQNDPTPTYMPITDQRLRDAATAKVGSYFIYQDSATGGIDSFGVTFFLQTRVFNQNDNTTNESIGFKSFDSVGGPGFVPVIDMGAYRNIINANIFLKAHSATGILMRLPFTVGAANTEYGITTINVQYYGSYNVLGRTYSAVYETKSFEGVNNTELHSWFSQQNGLIKFSLSDSGFLCTYLLSNSLIKK